MKKVVLILLAFVLASRFTYAQDLETYFHRLDQALVQADSTALTQILHPEVEIGHSNAWNQTKEDVWNDLKNKKVQYSRIKHLATLSVDSLENNGQKIASVFRKIISEGKYKTFDFSLTLNVLEVWIQEGNNWKLWKRQAVKVSQ